MEKSLTYVTSGVWSHRLFPARINSTCEQLFRADELPKMALERKKANRQLLDLFPNEKTNSDQLVLIGMCRVEESVISFYTKSPVMITHCSLTLYHRSSGGSDVCYHFSFRNTAVDSRCWCRASGDLWGEARESFLVYRSPGLGLPGRVESCSYMGPTLDLLVQNLWERIPSCYTESKHLQCNL